MAGQLLSWEQYARVWAGLHGGVDPRRTRPSVRRWLLVGFRVASVCALLRVRPGAITALGLLSCVAVPFVAVHSALVAALLVIFGATADTVAGALAVMTDRTTRLGYVYDSVVDRLSEACWLAGFWLLGVPAIVVVAAGGVSWLHEYARARANAAGMIEIGAATVGERPTRVIMAVIGFVLVALATPMGAELPASVATFAVAVWVVLAVVGFGQLLVAVHRALAGRAWPSWRAPGTPLIDAVAPRRGPPAQGATMARGTPADGLDQAGVSSTDHVELSALAEADQDDRVAELRAELARMPELPGSTSIYASTHAADEPLGRHGRVEADRLSSPEPIDAPPPRHADRQ